MRTRCVLICLLIATGCSPKRIAVRQLADTLAETGGSTVWSGDDDPELIRDALPFALKTMESLLASQPDHLGLHLALASGFTQYGYGFVQQEADRTMDRSYSEAQAGYDRARKLYARANDYAFRGLDLAHPGFRKAFKDNAQAAVKQLGVADVPFLYWAGASLGALIAVSKDRPELVAELPAVGVLMQRALELDEDYDAGAVHEFMISYESRSPSMGGSPERARKHYERALELTGGKKAGPYVSWAENQCVALQDRACFDQMMEKALAVNVDEVKAYRLTNVISQRRARWLQGRVADLIDTSDVEEETDVETEPTPESTESTQEAQ